jgi:uncharacterized integral membrane protein
MNFCSQCGKSLKSNQNNNKLNSNSNTKNSLYQFETIINKKNKTKFTVLIVLSSIFLIMAIFGIINTMKTSSSLYDLLTQPISIIVLFIYFALVISLLQPSTLNENEYYSIEGSKYANGQHQCISCNGKGIWKSTIYKTNIVQHQCSSCKKLLFTS